MLGAAPKPSIVDIDGERIREQVPMGLDGDFCAFGKENLLAVASVHRLQLPHAQARRPVKVTQPAKYFPNTHSISPMDKHIEVAKGSESKVAIYLHRQGRALIRQSFDPSAVQRIGHAHQLVRQFLVTFC